MEFAPRFWLDEVETFERKEIRQGLKIYSDFTVERSTTWSIGGDSVEICSSSVCLSHWAYNRTAVQWENTWRLAKTMAGISSEILIRSSETAHSYEMCGGDRSNSKSAFDCATDTRWMILYPSKKHVCFSTIKRLLSLARNRPVSKVDVTEKLGFWHIRIQHLMEICKRMSIFTIARLNIRTLHTLISYSHLSVYFVPCKITPRI